MDGVALIWSRVNSSEKALSIFGWTDRRMDGQDGEALIRRFAIFSEKNINNLRMDGWTDRWTDRHTDGQIDGQTDEQTDERSSPNMELREIFRKGIVNLRMDGQTGERTDGRTDKPS